MQRHDATGDVESNASASEAFVAGLVELIWTQIESVAGDVEAFAKCVCRIASNLCSRTQTCRAQADTRSVSATMVPH